MITQGVINMTPKIFTKAFLVYPNQLEARAQFKDNQGKGPDGIELYLHNTDFAKPEAELEGYLRRASDLFPTVNLETGDRLDPDGLHPADLLNPECQKYIERVLNFMDKIPNHGYLVVHLEGACQRLQYPYDGLQDQNKEELLAKCLDQVRRIDPSGKRIALENTFPTDWKTEPEPGKPEQGVISFYPFGKLSADFKEFPRVFDPGHCGITLYTLVNTVKVPHAQNGKFKSEEYGRIPVYFGPEEQAIAAVAQGSLIDAIVKEFEAIPAGKLRGIHINRSWKLSDGRGISEEADFNLDPLLHAVKKRPELSDLVIVTEFKETKTDPATGRLDYLNAPNQAEGLRYLRDFFSS